MNSTKPPNPFLDKYKGLKLMHLKALLMIFALPMAMSAQSVPVSAGEQLKIKMEMYFEELLERYPTFATMIGDERYNAAFQNDLTPEFRQKNHEFAKRWLKALESVKREQLVGQDRLSFDLMKRNLQEMLEGLKYPNHLQPIDQVGGLPIDFPMLGSGKSVQPFKTGKNYDEWLYTKCGCFWRHSRCGGYLQVSLYGRHAFRTGKRMRQG